MFLAALDGYMHRKYGALKSKLLSAAPRVVVELGPGAGANLRYLAPGTELVAIEPNRRMHGVLRRRAQQRGVDLRLHELAGEALDLPSASVDFVFASLVLCSVARPDDVVSEVLRVLRPGGRFVCIEHVAAPAGSPIHRLQGAIEPPWRWLFEGCELRRDTASTLQAAGFSSVDVERIVLPTIFFPVRHQIAAICIK